MTDTVSLDYRKLPYKPLFLDYQYRFDAVSPFFHGDPRSPRAWRDVASELRGRRHPTDEVIPAIARLNGSLGADDVALASAEALGRGALAVVTGQQVGLLGGPLYTLYKALSAVRLARWASSTLEREIVPLFWMDADDHDFDEVRHAYVLGSSNDVVDLRYDSSDPESRVPVGGRKLEPSISELLSAAAEALAPSEFKEDVLGAVGSCYAPGRTMSDAFGSFLLHMTRGTGLLVVDPTIPELKRAAAGLFDRELRGGTASSRVVRETTERLLALGYHAQASPPESNVNLFYADPNREPIAAEEAEERARRVREEPERFSPNVLLRPLYQDTLFPTVAYVAGPSEVAYFAQLKDVYAHFETTMPLIASRSSFTVIERPQARFLERYGVDVTRLDSDDESVLNEILRQHAPKKLEEDLTRARSCIQDITKALEKDLASVDTTLVPTVQSTRGKLLHHLKELESKALRAVKRKNETVRNQFLATRTALFPDFSPQERKLSPLVFLNKYGWHFTRMIEEKAEPNAQAHLLLYT
jgi:bacillithiol biosynthesis cysteine-adding enzyme BshC